MKAVFEQKIYNRIPVSRTVNYRGVSSHKFEYDGVELEAVYSSNFNYIVDETVYSHSNKYVVDDDLYRLFVGDKYFLKEINRVVKIIDKTIINDNEIIFLIDEIDTVKCENYADIYDKLCDEEQQIRDEKIKLAEERAIQKHLDSIACAKDILDVLGDKKSMFGIFKKK